MDNAVTGLEKSLKLLLREIYGPFFPCSVRIDFLHSLLDRPNKVDTAKYLSDRLGVTTVIKEQESISFQGGTGFFAKKSVTKSQQEVQRAVLTPDEIMRLPGPVKDINQNIVEPGDMLIFSASFPPIYGKQILYFLDKVFSERSKIDAPAKSDVIKEVAA